MAREEAEADLGMWRYIFGFVEMAVVKCAIELRVADVIENHGGSISLSSLSSAVGCSPTGLYRVMRFLVNRRLFKESETSHGEACYQQTPLSRRLMTRGDDAGMVAIFLLESSPVMLAPWHYLSAWLQGKVSSPFDAAHGVDLWEYGASHPAHGKLFNDSMACITAQAVSAIVSGCPEVFDGVSSVVDVGGGDGTALRTLIKARPSIRGINFDLPHVVAAAPECDGVECVGGDMFDAVPSADAVFIKWVLHDWGDKECIQILKNCRESIPREKGKVIIIEVVIGRKENEGDENNTVEGVKLMLDMMMMTHTTGKERTLKEWDYVIKSAGFSRYTVKPLGTVGSLIEAYP